MRSSFPADREDPVLLLCDNDEVLKGIAAFNERRFFESHETLELVWRESAGREREFLQALIQVAVAYHHYLNGNCRGAASLMARALSRLERLPADFHGFSVADLRNCVVDNLKAIESAGGGRPPDLAIARIDCAKRRRRT